MADYGLHTNNLEVRGIACAPSMFIQRSNAEDDIELDNLNRDGTVRTENAGPSGQNQNQNQNQNTSTNQGGSGGDDVRDGDDQGSTIDAQCRPLKDFTRLLTCCFYCSTKGKDRGRTHDAPPKIVNAPLGIDPTRPPPQETPEQSPPQAKLPPRASVSPTRCNIL